ncbi:MAG: hypothetical protein EOP06_22240 [Proteobacteria bacterium]|nr:MAG: hypothetical protein EOP06_22240 [Pseudomonadota bacterium]
MAIGVGTLSGRPDRESGMLVDLPAVDRCLEAMNGMLSEKVWNDFSEVLQECLAFAAVLLAVDAAQLRSLRFTEERGDGFGWDQSGRYVQHAKVAQFRTELYRITLRSAEGRAGESEVFDSIAGHENEEFVSVAKLVFGQNPFAQSIAFEPLTSGDVQLFERDKAVT